MCDDTIPAAQRLLPCPPKSPPAAAVAAEREATYCLFHALLAPAEPVKARVRALLAPLTNASRQTTSAHDLLGAGDSVPPPASLRLVVGLHARFGEIGSDPLRLRASDARGLLHCVAGVISTWRAHMLAYYRARAAPPPSLAATVVMATDQPARLRFVLDEESDACVLHVCGPHCVEVGRRG